MPGINALFLTTYVRTWLATTSHPRILHIFDSACNLINEHGEVLSIVTPQVGKGPFNIVVQDELVFLKYFNVESSLTLSPNQLTLGNLFIDTTKAEIWDPHPDWETLHRQRGAVFSRLQDLQIPNEEFPTSGFSSALLYANLQQANVIASQLAGLGSGLTPAGDDFLMGAMYAAWILHPPEIAGPFLQEIASTAAPLTTSLSAAWLIAAGQGEAGILWHNFFETLLSEDKIRSQVAMDRILAVGETSGLDAMVGFLGTVFDWTQLKHV